jgi:hypothetical protein
MAPAACELLMPLFFLRASRFTVVRCVWVLAVVKKAVYQARSYQPTKKDVCSCGGM